MNQHRIHIRVDAGSEVGMGHLIRCLSLAHMLKSTFSIQFYLKRGTQDFSMLLNENGFIANNIERESQFFKMLHEGDIVVLDGYHFDISYQRIVLNTKVKLVCIDDLCNIDSLADIIINHAPGVTKSDYAVSVVKSTKFLLGPNYALLRPAFLSPMKHKASSSLDSVLICFGGADPRNLSLRVLEVISEFDWLKNVTLIIGKAYAHHVALHKWIKGDEKRPSLNVEVRQNLTEKQMIEAFHEASLYIVPASGILFEAMRISGLIISGYYVENQKGIYNGFKSGGTFIDAGNFTDDELRAAIEKANCVDKLDLQKKQSEYIDGKSGERLLREFETLIS